MTIQQFKEEKEMRKNYHFCNCGIAILMIVTTITIILKFISIF